MSRDLARYFEQSRRLSVGLILVLPLLLVYEAGMLITGSGVVNHAGALVERMIRLFGYDTYLALTGAVAGLFLLALFRKRTGPAKGFTLYWLMLFEAGFYGALLGPAARAVQARMGALSAAAAAPTFGVTMLLYLGAGVWEEIVFRLVLLGGLVALTVNLLGGNRRVFATVALLVSSLAFSLFHHVGPLADPFDGRLFLFRTLAGLALGLLFLLRGLGICVYTHAFYNVALLLFSR